MISALVKLSENLNQTLSLIPICLPDSEEYFSYSFEGLKCTVTGWGLSHNNSTSFSDILHEAKIKILNSSVCHNVYNTPKYGFVKIRKSHICGGELDGSAGTCMVSISVISNKY